MSDPTARGRRAATTWQQRLHAALGTTTPLSGISTDSLRRAITHFRTSGDRDAWIWATVCGAELARRDVHTPRPATTGLTAAELAWGETRRRRTDRQEVAA